MTIRAQGKSLGEFGRRGFSLGHPDDHILLLLHEGELVARFSQTGATAESLRSECARHLVMKHGWEGVSGKERRGDRHHE